MILVIGDVHWKETSPHREGLIEFFDWLTDNYAGSTLIMTGDWLDSTSLHHENVIDTAIHKLNGFKEIHIVSGNHEISKIKGNILKPLNHINNINVYLEKTEVSIEGNTFLFLPYLPSLSQMREEYTKIKWKGDFCISHFAYPGTNFGHSDEIDISGIDAIKIYGHIHEHKIMSDRDINIGVPATTRFGEHVWDKKIGLIDKDKKLKLIDIPVFWTYEELNYGQKPVNAKNVLVIKKAPSVIAVNEMYKDYKVHESKIEIFRNSGNENSNNIEYTKESLNGSLLKQFRDYTDSVSDPVPEEIKSEIESRLIHHGQ